MSGAREAIYAKPGSKGPGTDVRSTLILESLRRLGRDQKPGLALAQFDALVRTGIAAVATHRVPIAMQQLMGLGDVSHFGRRALHVVHQARGIVHADVRLHPEIPLVALPGLMHVRVTLALGVFGRAWRGDDRGIDDRPAAQTQSLVRQVHVDPAQQLARQIMDLQQTSEVEDRGLVRDPVQPTQLAKRRITGMSYSASSMPGSLNAYHCCSKWMRSIVSSAYG